ncbi:MAG: 30S ribosomal protein S12 methylthiotransferase RimO [bacterium]
MIQEKNKITVTLTSLGCPKNLVDSEIMIGFLKEDGFEIVEPHKPAHVHIINTCSFVGDAKAESLETIFTVAQQKEAGTLQLLVVTGCLPQRYAIELIKEIPEVDLFLGVGDYPKITEIIKNKLTGKKERNFVATAQFLPDHLTPRTQTTPFYTKYVKISEGCSHQCSFCTIPSIRGTLISRKSQDVFQEIETGVAHNVKEFNLVAQDLNEYGRDLEPRDSLFKLLTKLEILEGDFWLRLLYMYPLQFPNKLIDLIKEHPHIIKYVDIPLQHISDNLLKLMDRGSSSLYIHRLIDQLKTKIPEITLRTTFIVGHPGETDKDFDQLHKFIKDYEFQHVGVFKYSNEEGTPSFNMPDHVSDKIMEERLHILMSAQKEISQKLNQQYIGKTIKVLFEGESQETELLYQGRHAGQAPDIDGITLINSGSASIGSFCDVKITEAFEYDVLGEIVS